MSGRVVHFELPYDDGERVRGFYRQAFGWTLQEMPEMSVEDLGGKTVVGKQTVGEMGFVAYVDDTEGNLIGLWENA